MAKIDKSGRLVIPSSYRKELGWQVGGDVVLRVQDGELRVVSAGQAIARIQALVRARTKGRTLSDELIAERRRDAERE